MAVTSLLKSAAATRKRIRAQEDALAAYQWESSAQTYEDFLAYSKYLTDRGESVTDASDQMTYATKLRSARRSYTSNELQRQQMAIMEGRATTQDKMNAIRDLYGQAVENGDLNLAQNLYSQWDALSIKLQNEQEQAIKSYQAAGSKAFDDLQNKLIKGAEDVVLPNGQTVTPLSLLSQAIEQTGDTVAVMQAGQETLEALRAVIIDRYQSATTQEEVDKLEEKYGAGLQNIDKELTLKVPGLQGGLTLQEVTNAVANEQFNNPIFGLKAVRNEATGETEYKLQRNNVERIDYVRQFDEQGNEFYAPASIRTDQNNVVFGSSDQGRGLSTQITNEGSVVGNNDDGTGNINAGQGTVERNDSMSIQNRLKSLGIIAKQNGTTLSIKLPGENVEREATIQPDGSIRYFDDEGNMVEVGLTRRNLGTDSQPVIAEAGQPRIVSPEELSDFGTQSAFGGTLSQASRQGERYLTDILGRAQVNAQTPLAGPIRTGNDFGGFGTAVTSNLLQTAGSTRQQFTIQKQKEEMLQKQAQMQLQASQTFNLNQTPVQQLTGSGILKRQLRVAAPVAAPRVYVAPPPSTPNITNVSVAQPTQRISGVTQLPAQPRVRVY